MGKAVAEKGADVNVLDVLAHGGENKPPEEPAEEDAAKCVPASPQIRQSNGTPPMKRLCVAKLLQHRRSHAITSPLAASRDFSILSSICIVSTRLWKVGQPRVQAASKV